MGNDLNTLLTTWIADMYAGTISVPSLVVPGASGGTLTLGTSTELLTVAAAATSDTVASMLPASSIILGVSCRVTTIIPSATSFVLGGKSAGGPFTETVLVAANSVNAGSLACPYYNVGAQKVTLTITGSNPANNTGRVRINVFYLTVTPPTA